MIEVALFFLHHRPRIGPCWSPIRSGRRFDASSVADARPVIQSHSGVILTGSGRNILNVLVAISSQASAISVSTFYLTADR
ncbi:MAG: hypothetical protein JW751_01300 [Polyangiaceae bacterium]|nr:hypothetical protein [Polyangiaceae bacterium]